jgi:hypothetical protein
MAWKIKNWNETYENNKSRQLKELPWYREPTVTDTYGFAFLIAKNNGIAFYGVWALLKKVAATAPQSQRGYLMRGINKPHTIQTLSFQTRIPEELIREAIEALLDPEIAWLEEVDLPGVSTKPLTAQTQDHPPEEAPVVHLDEIAEHICARHPKPKTMSVQACGRLLEKIIEGAAEPAKWLKHIEAHHAWRCENEWADCEPRFVKTLAKWLQEDPMAPIPDSNQRKEEPDYVERF